MRNNILAIIPAYNEEANIVGVISSVKQSMQNVDIVVINDGSVDSTSKLVRKEDVVLLDIPYNLGIGAARQTGFMYAKEYNYDIAIQMDADGQHVPEDANKLIGVLTKQNMDMVIGSRFIEDDGYKSTITRRLGIRIFAFVVSFITNQKFTDTTSGFRVYSKRTINFFSKNYPEDYPEVESIILLNKIKYKMMEFPVSMLKRKGGKSSITPIKSVYYMIRVFLAIFVNIFREAPKED